MQVTMGLGVEKGAKGLQNRYLEQFAYALLRWVSRLAGPEARVAVQLFFAVPS